MIIRHKIEWAIHLGLAGSLLVAVVFAPFRVFATGELGDALILGLWLPLMVDCWIGALGLGEWWVIRGIHVRAERLARREIERQLERWAALVHHMPAITVEFPRPPEPPRALVCRLAQTRKCYQLVQFYWLCLTGGIAGLAAHAARRGNWWMVAGQVWPFLCCLAITISRERAHRRRTAGAPDGTGES